MNCSAFFVDSFDFEMTLDVIQSIRNGMHQELGHIQLYTFGYEL